MTGVDLKTMTDAALKGQWAVAVKAMNAAYDDLTAVSRMRAEYNRTNYLKLHRTVSGKRQYDLVQTDLDATEAKARKSYWAAVEACTPYADEIQRRGVAW